MALNLYWNNIDDVLSQVKQERKLSEDTIETKRRQIQDRIRLINWQDKPQDKVNINTAAAQINTFIALSYADELTVSFLPRNTADEEVADNKTILASYDFDEMWLDMLNYQKQFDRWFNWLSIRRFTWFNEYKIHPEVVIEDPLVWYADPHPKWFSAQDFRWHWFEYETTMDELEADESFYNLSDIPQEVSDDMHTTNNEYSNAARLNNQDDETPNKIFTIYYHYTKLDNRRYLVVTDESFSTIIKLIRFEAVKLEEKKDPSLIPCPIVINYFKPRRGNIYGDSIMDYVEDKQRADSKLFNLQLHKATREALGWDFLVNKNKIGNKNQLATPTSWKRYISVDLEQNESLDNIMKEVPSEKLSVDVENMRQLLKREVANSTWVDSIIQGIRWDKSITARESQTIQSNANLNLALNNKIDSWGEKEFWNLWNRFYEEHFSDSDVKLARLSSWFGSKNVTFKKDDFLWGTDIDVIIENKSDVEAKLEQQKENIAFFQQMAQDPTLPEITKLFLNRKVARLMWMPKPEIDFIYRKNTDELNAIDQVKILNLWENINNFISPEEDQLTFLMYYERAEESANKQIAISKRTQLLVQQEERKREENKLLQEDGQWWVSQWTLNQLTSNAISKDRVKGEAVSAQDIAQ
mgnify:CR=1 FL=1